MTRFVSRYPVIFSILAVLFAMLIVNPIGAALAFLKLDVLNERLVIEAIFSGYVILLLSGLRCWRAAGFIQPEPRRKLWAFLPLLLLPMLVIASSDIKGAGPVQIVLYTILAFLVGFAEEGLIRGVVLRALLPRGLTRAVLLSSVLFGLGHLANIVQGFSLDLIVVQTIYATFLGIAFAGVRSYTGSIWPAVVAHALIDFSDGFSRGFVLPQPQPITMAGIIAPIVITGLYALYGWWLLWRATKNTQIA